MNLILEGDIQGVENLAGKTELHSVNTALGLKAVKLSRLASIADTKNTFTYTELAKELNVFDWNTSSI